MDRATVVAVERRVYSREYQEPEHLIEARLRYEDDHYGSLNLGLFAGDELMGYVLAYLDDGAEIAQQAIGDNVYVADMAILPGYERHLLKLITAFAREVRLEYPGLPIVAHAIRETGKMWRRHHAVFRKLGFTLAAEPGAEAAQAGQAVPLIVWEPLAAGRRTERKPPADSSHASARFRSSSGKELRTSLVTDEDGLLSLQEHWQSIERAVPGLTVFQTHRYQAAWVRSFAVDLKLMIVCIHDGNELIGMRRFRSR